VPTVVLLGTFDTKAAEYAFLRDRLLEHGCDTLLVDAAILDQPADDRLRPDVTADEVAAAAGEDRAALAAAHDRGPAVQAMARGAAAVVTRLHREGRLDALLGAGGSGGSSIVSEAARALPIGVPKLLVSTMASGDTRPFVDTSDLALMPSIVDVAGLNGISRLILSNAAAAVAGMASAPPLPAGPGERPLIAATMFGVTTPGVSAARAWLEANGYEVIVFHATGTGGRAMETLMRAGYLAGVLDVTTTELVDELVGGVLSAGPERLEAAGALGLPQVVSLGALDMGNFGPKDSVPERYRDRNLYVHNAAVTLMRTTPAECAELGRVMARKLNLAKGPLTVFVPRRGVSMLSVPGGPFHDPGADAALVRELRAALRPGIEVVEQDTDINDPAFGTAMAVQLDALVRASAGARAPAGAAGATA
jgi:uncharacterized protein (UPF0261 family)